jgi:acetyltransferase-like isoleucine patch superfamily enzyme
MLSYYKNNKLIKKTRISSSVEFIKEENIEIGENVFVWHHTILDGSSKLTISEGCQIGANVSIFTHSSHIAIRLFGKHYTNECKGKIEDGYILKQVFIGKYTFIATGSVILPGITIGKGCIVSANSLVTQNLPDYAIVQGNPAQIIGDTRKLDKRYLKRDKKFQDYYQEWDS